jgi:hypothetical protein
MYKADTHGRAKDTKLFHSITTVYRC